MPSLVDLSCRSLALLSLASQLTAETCYYYVNSTTISYRSCDGECCSQLAKSSSTTCCDSKYWWVSLLVVFGIWLIVALIVTSLVCLATRSTIKSCCRRHFGRSPCCCFKETQSPTVHPSQDNDPAPPYQPPTTVSSQTETKHAKEPDDDLPKYDQVKLQK